MPELTAGLISAVLDGAALRDVRVAGYRALDAVYVTVRDTSWRTVPGEVLFSRRVTTGAGPKVEFDVRHELEELDFRWHGTIEATPGRMLFTLDGVAETDFDANRIGFCLLHPQSLKGRALRVDGPRGPVEGQFPEWISPYQPFVDVQLMRSDIGEGAELEIRLTGDLFEVEDHRNWSDPGWKTYCPPLSAPRPVRRRAADRLWQSVELIAHVSGSGSAPHRIGAPARLTVGSGKLGVVPRLGLGASCLPNLDPDVLDLLRSLAPSHLHVELEYSGEWEGRLAAAVAEAAAIDVPLDVALVAGPQQLPPMAAAMAHISRGAGARLGRISAYSADRHTTDATTMSALRAAVATHMVAGFRPALGGGSRANFAELNRGEFYVDDWDFVAYGLTPQVHHTDDRSILATLAAISDVMHQSVAMARGRPVVVGPVTLRPRFNPDLGRADPLPPDISGPDVDARQRTLLAAVYLAGAVTALLGAHAVTAYRSVGPRGVLGADGSLTPAADVFREIARLGGAAVRKSFCDDPEVLVLAIDDSVGTKVIVVNPSERAKPIELSGGQIRGLRILGEEPHDDHGSILPGHSVVLIDALLDGAPGSGPEATR